MKISQKYSKSVFDDAMSAIEKTSHPCRPMVDWQINEDYSPFQLPEPFSGSETNLKLAFMGLNPSASRDEIIPTRSDEWSFEKYDSFYRSRFDANQRDSQGKLFVNFRDGSKPKVRLWNNIEIFGNQYLTSLTGGSFHLGKNAILIEAVRYKSTKGWLGNNSNEKKGIINDQIKFTKKLMEENAFSILVPMGNGALHQMERVLKFQKKIPKKISDAMGHSFLGKTCAGSTVIVCPIKHLSYPPSLNEKEAVAKQIIQAYETLNE